MALPPLPPSGIEICRRQKSPRKREFLQTWLETFGIFLSECHFARYSQILTSRSNLSSSAGGFGPPSRYIQIQTFSSARQFAELLEDAWNSAAWCHHRGATCFDFGLGFLAMVPREPRRKVWMCETAYINTADLGLLTTRRGPTRTEMLHETPPVVAHHASGRRGCGNRCPQIPFALPAWRHAVNSGAAERGVGEAASGTGFRRPLTRISERANAVSLRLFRQVRQRSRFYSAATVVARGSFGPDRAIS
jgi:hypothetical protein